MKTYTTENCTVQMTETFVSMTDGVKLYTRITVPLKKDKCPVVFIRTPYEKSHNGQPHDVTLYENDEFIQHGYAVVLQHTRGRGDSEGICIPYESEQSDGLDTLAYIRTLPFYNGEIFLWGKSYLATAHLSYLSTKPQDIKGAVFDIQTDRMFFRNYRNGCCYKFCNISWWAKMMKRSFPQSNTAGALVRPYKDIAKRVFGEDIPEYTAGLMNDTYNDFWKNDPRANVIESIDFPVLFREGWYDFYNDGMFDMWKRLPAETKKKSVFVVGPWGHDTKVSKDAALPLENGNLPYDHAVSWFDSIRSKEAYKYAHYGTVTYYSIGSDVWKNECFPCGKQDSFRLYFNENAALTSTESSGEISYKYNPQKKNNFFKYETVHAHENTEAFDDIVSFISEEICSDMNFFGNIRWHMNVSSNCDDTAFFIRIYFVRNNVAYNLTETITTLLHVNPQYKRYSTQLLDLTLPPIGFSLKKGDRIRVDISSNGTIYVPHSNLNAHWALAPTTRIATNTILTKDSFIELPITQN